MYPIAQLTQTSNLIRQDIIKMLVQAGSGHSAGSLGMADVFTALYFYLLKHDPKRPNWNKRDRLLLSNGHICPVLYAALARAGYFSAIELSTLRQLGSRLQGHTHFVMTDNQNKDQASQTLPGIENTSGPLGQGVSQAVGVALGLQMDKRKNQVICITSDGEQQEGQVWEAYMCAAKYNLGNLTYIMDRNNIQIDGYVHEVMPLTPLVKKLEAFGLFVLEIDGHNLEEIIDAYQKSLTIHDQPTMIVAHTIPGKDVEFMQDLPEWHGKTPSLGDSVEALRELRQLYGQITVE